MASLSGEPALDASPVAVTLRRVVAQLPGGGEARPGQAAMAAAVREAIRDERHLVVQAGTGTGKTLAYLVPALDAGRRTVVATATKALQDQLADKDLPFLEQHLGRPFTWAVLKGRSNYLCRQRLTEVATGGQLELDDVGGSPVVRQEIARLARWAEETDEGERSALDWEPSSRAWAAVSVSAQECPGAARCPEGARCFAELARRRAAAADVVVVNTHLYGLHVAGGGYLLPEHDVLVVDEAHQLEDVLAATAGSEVGAGRFAAVARALRRVVADDALVGDVAATGLSWPDGLDGWQGRLLPRTLPADLADHVATARERVARAGPALSAVDVDAPGDVAARKLRAQKLLLALLDDLDRVAGLPEGDVAWVEAQGRDAQAVLTSATLPPALPARLGLPEADHVTLDVGSPFDFATQGLLYCAADLPDPRATAFEPAVHDRLAALVDAAGGRTLALFTSWRAMRAAVDALRARVAHPILAQGDLPKPALVDAFVRDEASCLFATMGFWQGLDVPGRTLSLVTVDRLPFPRPDDPLLQARRRRAGAEAFATIDLPRAATLLAQAAGRLIRTAHDHGVVAVLDRRLATGTYRWDLVRALPPMRRTRHLDDAVAFLRTLARGQDGRPL